MFPPAYFFFPPARKMIPLARKIFRLARKLVFLAEKFFPIENSLEARRFVPTTKVAVWGPPAKRPPTRTPLLFRYVAFPPVRAGGRLAGGPQTATLVVGTWTLRNEVIDTKWILKALPP